MGRAAFHFHSFYSEGQGARFGQGPRLAEPVLEIVRHECGDSGRNYDSPNTPLYKEERLPGVPSEPSIGFHAGTRCE